MVYSLTIFMVSSLGAISYYKLHGYKAEINSDVKGFVCFVLELALPPFSPALPSVVQF